MSDAQVSLKEYVGKLEGNDLVELRVGVEEVADTEVVYLPARIVRSMLRKHTIHPSEQYILTQRMFDSKLKAGYRDDLVLYTKVELLKENIDLDLLLKDGKVYIERQLVMIKNFNRFGDKNAEMKDLHELTRVARYEAETKDS